jgi:hypothetical protein
VNKLAYDTSNVEEDMSNVEGFKSIQKHLNLAAEQDTAQISVRATQIRKVIVEVRRRERYPDVLHNTIQSAPTALTTQPKMSFK